MAIDTGAETNTQFGDLFPGLADLSVIEVASPEDVSRVCHDYTKLASDGLRTIRDLVEPKARIEDARLNPKRYSEAALDDARGLIADWNSLLHRQTDELAHGFVISLPAQRIGRQSLLGFLDFDLVTDRYLLGLGDNLTAFVDMLTQDESFSPVVERASTEQWESLLWGVSLRGRLTLS